MRCIWSDKQHDLSSDRSMFKTFRVMEDVFLYNVWSLTYVHFRDRYTRHDIVQRYRAKSGTKLLRDTRQLASSVPITNRCRPCLSTRSTDRKIPSHDFHKASECDPSFAEYVQRSRKRSRMACAFRSFNTVLMIYVSEYILHRILSHINIDTGSETFHVLLARHGRYFYFA